MSANASHTHDLSLVERVFLTSTKLQVVYSGIR